MTDGGSSIPEVRALLRVLAAGRRCAELGTAFGEGAAAIAETAVSLVTCEIDGERASVARERLRQHRNVEILLGDWHDVLPQRAPFDLVFADGGHWKRSVERDGPRLLDLLAPNGMLVVDDMTPGRSPDPVRDFLFASLTAVEILTTPSTAALIGVRAA